MAKENKKEERAEGDIPLAALAYAKAQIVKSKRYAEQRDILETLLEDGKVYTHADVARIIDAFMKGTVR